MSCPLHLRKIPHIQVHCNMEGINCDGEGGWTRIGYINMTQSGATCPDGLTQQTYNNINHPLCGRQSGPGCSSTTFSSTGLTYNKVCGQVRGYQYRSPDGMEGVGRGIDSYYVDGVSITYERNPRRHIWTYIAGIGEAVEDNRVCPCNVGYTGTNPLSTFIGSHYYCESALEPPGEFTYIVYVNDTLWDGEQCCHNEVSCCPTNSKMPWFYRLLDSSTSEDIELRVCYDQDYPDENTPLDTIELYIK